MYRQVSDGSCVIENALTEQRNRVFNRPRAAALCCQSLQAVVVTVIAERVAAKQQHLHHVSLSWHTVITVRGASDDHVRLTAGWPGQPSYQRPLVRLDVICLA